MNTFKKLTGILEEVKIKFKDDDFNFINPDTI